MVIFCVALQLKAQKGSLLIYGSGGVYLSKSEGQQASNKTTQINFSPGVGYQFDNSWTTGVYSGYTYYKSNDQKFYNLEIGPFIRYTKILSSIFGFYAQLNTGYVNTKYNGSSNVNGFRTAVYPAVFVNLKNNFGLNFSFGGIDYSNYKFKTDDSKSSSFNLSFGQSVNIGVSKNFGRKKS